MGGGPLTPTGHISGPPDLRGTEKDILPFFQSACPSHFFLGTESECKGCPGLAQRGLASMGPFKMSLHWEHQEVLV